MIIYAMRTNHLVNPLGYELAAPSFSWKVKDSVGSRQTAARVEVSTDEAFAALTFDSGKSETADSLTFQPTISPAPRTRYYWRVTVWSDAGECAVSDTAYFETAKQDEPWQGKWIAAPFKAHPLLRRSFALAGKIASARLYACGVGLYEMSVNGREISPERLAPLCTDYRYHLQYQTYDVTTLLQPGENQLSAILGKGWYMGRIGYGGGSCDLFGDTMALLCELRVRLTDGSEVVLGTDDTWQCTPSPVLESGIYDGEKQDARIKPVDFQPVVWAKAPASVPTARLSPPVRVIETRKPVLITTPKGEQVLDFGQVMTGWVEFDCAVSAGMEIYLQYGELLQDECFYRGNLRSAKEEFSYTSDGQPAHVRPYFTFFGFRFVKVTGLEKVDPAAFTGCVIHSDLTELGHIFTSNDKVNRLIENARWSQKGNFLDVPTDCPQRDERMGWTGDAQVFAPTACYTMETPAFYRKFLWDMTAEQRQLGGCVPFVVPDVLHAYSDKQGRPNTDKGSCAWGDAATIVPWTVYEFFGDTALLAEAYEGMKLWADYIHNQDEGDYLWRKGFHFADWLALDNPDKNSNFGGTDEYYIASAYYYYSTRLTARAAGVLGKAEDQALYGERAEAIRAAIRREYFTVTNRIAIPSQTAMALALALDLAPEAARPRLIKDLRERLARRKDHLDTGFVGTYFLLSTLSDNGLHDVACTLLLKEDFPSWLYEVNMGATTIWERWNSVLPDGHVSDTGMNSMNHYAYGAVVEWMYKQLCGLRAAAPGFRKAVIAPKPDRRFTFAQADYDSASGMYQCRWEWQGAQVKCSVQVPFGGEGQFVVPDGFHVADQLCEITLKPGVHTILLDAE